METNNCAHNWNLCLWTRELDKEGTADLTIACIYIQHHKDMDMKSTNLFLFDRPSQLDI